MTGVGYGYTIESANDGTPLALWWGRLPPPPAPPAGMPDAAVAERPIYGNPREQIARLCVCNHFEGRHTADGCTVCAGTEWPCSHFVSMAAVRASDRTVGPAWPKLVVAVLALLLTSCAVAPCLERCAASPGTFGGCWCVERVIVGGR